MSGVPQRPGAWLVTVGKRRWFDTLRRKGTLEGKQADLTRQAEVRQQLTGADFDDVEEEVGDDRLRLIFTACHPVLPREARVALTLRLVAGLTTEEIARAYLVREPTVAQRVVRAKRSLSEARVPFELPPANQLQERLDAVLEVVYLVFNEGYAATAGEQWARPELCHEALRLGRIIAQLLPAEPEVHGLVALMELQASRLRARVGPGGEPVLLADQDRSRWDPLLVRRGLAALEPSERARQLPGQRARARAVRPSGGDCGMPRAGRNARRHRLGSHLCPLRSARAGRTLSGGGAEQGRGAVHGVRAGGWPRGRRLPRARPVARGLLPVAERPWRPASQAWAVSRKPVPTWRRAASLTRNEREQQLLLERAALPPQAHLAARRRRRLARRRGQPAASSSAEIPRRGVITSSMRP